MKKKGPAKKKPKARRGNPLGPESKCAYCKRKMTIPRFHRQNDGLARTRDHYVPKSFGGSRTIFACRACNSVKADMMPDEWKIFMEENPRWWRLYGPKEKSDTNM